MKLISSFFITFLYFNTQAQTAPNLINANSGVTSKLSSQATNATANLPDPLKLSANSFNFGKIVYGKPVYTTFVITNNGKVPLTVSNIATSCGCTTPEWDKAPIAPGANTNVKVGFSGNAEGAFSKTVTITYLDNKSQTFTISGTGIKAPEVSSKPNNSINLLRQSF